MPDLTPERLAEFERLAMLATAGDVKVIDRSPYRMSANDPRWELDEASGREHFWIGLFISAADAQFYAALRNSASDLIEAAKENVRLREAVGWAYQAIGARSPNLEALDNLSAISRGDPTPHEWPVVPPVDDEPCQFCGWSQKAEDALQKLEAKHDE